MRSGLWQLRSVGLLWTPPRAGDPYQRPEGVENWDASDRLRAWTGIWSVPIAGCVDVWIDLIRCHRCGVLGEEFTSLRGGIPVESWDWQLMKSEAISNYAMATAKWRRSHYHSKTYEVLWSIQTWRWMSALSKAHCSIKNNSITCIDLFSRNRTMSPKYI